MSKSALLNKAILKVTSTVSKVVKSGITLSCNSTGVLSFNHKKFDNSNEALINLILAFSKFSFLSFKVIPASKVSIAGLSPATYAFFVLSKRNTAFSKKLSYTNFSL